MPIPLIIVLIALWLLVWGKLWYHIGRLQVALHLRDGFERSVLRVIAWCFQ